MTPTLDRTWAGLVDDAAVFPPGDAPLPEAVEAHAGRRGEWWADLVGSFVVGMFVEVSTLIIPTELKNVGALLVLIVVLLFRPQGILGRAERIG